MPVITVTPQPISTTPLCEPVINTGSVPSFFQKTGGNLYFVCLTDDSGVSHVTVFKSANAGVSWSIADSSNRPTQAQGCGSAFDGTAIHICYGKGSVAGVINYVAFSTSTDTFGVSIPNPSGETNEQLAIAISSTKLYCFADDTQVFGAVGNFAIFDLGSLSWDSTFAPFDFTLPANTATPVYGAAVDGSGNGHVLYLAQNISAPLREFRHVSVNSGGGLSSPTTIYTDTIPLTILAWSLTYWSGQLIVAASPATQVSEIAVSTDGGSTWSYHDASPSSLTDLAGITVMASPTGSFAYVFWFQFDGTGSECQLWYATWNGSIFGTSTEYWDMIALPAGTGVSSSDVNVPNAGITGALISSDSILGMVIYTQLNSGGDITAFYAPGGAGPITVSAYRNRFYLR